MKNGEMWLCVSSVPEYAFDQMAWKDHEGRFHWWYLEGYNGFGRGWLEYDNDEQSFLLFSKDTLAQFAIAKFPAGWGA